jgi:hypothetical protein
MAVACYVDVKMGVERWKESKKLEQLICTELELTRAKLYYCQGQEKIYEIEAKNAVNELTILAESSIPYMMESIDSVYDANMGISRSVVRLRDKAPDVFVEIKEALK